MFYWEKLAFLGLALTVGAASAADYPVRPIRFVVPQPPGGGTDIVGRLLAVKLSESLSQQVVVDNRAGAGGIVGTEMVAKAPADGYTLLLAYTGSMTINPNIHSKLPYRPLEDFDPVSLAASSAFVLAMNPGVKANTVQELIALAKSRAAAPLNYGSPGNGSLHQLAMEWLRVASGIQLTHVPYKGSQSFNAVMAGEVPMAFVSLVSSLPHVKGGKAKALAVTSKARSSLLPNVPTMAESSGIADFEAANWFGVVVPRGTPGPIIAKLSGLVATHMKAPEMKERMLADGGEAIGSTPAEFGDLMRRELKRWATVVKMSGAKVE